MEIIKSVIPIVSIVLLILLFCWGIVIVVFLWYKKKYFVNLPKEDAVTFIANLNDIPVMTIRVTCNKKPTHNRTIVAIPELTDRGIIYSPSSNLDACEHCIFWGSIAGEKEVRL